MYPCSSDWLQISFLYRALWAFEPTSVVALNWAVAIAETGQPELALQKMDELEPELKNYQPWYAARAHVLEKLGQFSGARDAYLKAIEIALSSASCRFLERKIRLLPA